MSLFLVRRPTTPLYDAVSEGSAAVVIRQYSSSFGLASRLLAEPVRTQVRNVYALVRVADEIVDNPDPALGVEARARMLSWLQEDVRHALRTGYSGNLVVHAFARTAIACGITDEGWAELTWGPLTGPSVDDIETWLRAFGWQRGSPESGTAVLSAFEDGRELTARISPPSGDIGVRLTATSAANSLACLLH